jgi:hypothetical protein
MTDDEDDLRLAANATFGVVILNSLFWAWLFYMGLFSFFLDRNSKHPMMMFIPTLGIFFSIVLPICLERMKTPRLALGLAVIFLVGMPLLLIDVFMHTGI